MEFSDGEECVRFKNFEVAEFQHTLQMFTAECEVAEMGLICTDETVYCWIHSLTLG